MVDVIRRLPTEVRNAIRSGISITNASQCVVELVLNSLDSGATSIAIRVDFVFHKFQVVDNGCGMDMKTLDLVGLRYMTSKCNTIDDLKRHLDSHGFRGEALASIRNQSGSLVIESRTSVSETFCKVFTCGRAQDAILSKTRRPSRGTTVTVHDFMYNLPVRQKRINETVDLEEVKSLIEAIALINPGVAFSLRNDVSHNIILQTQKTFDILKTFSCLFEETTANTLVEIKHATEKYKVSGYIGIEAVAHKNIQLVYVNKRVVRKTKLHKLVNAMMSKSSLLQGEREVPGVKKKSHGNWLAYSPPPSRNKFAVFMLNIECAHMLYDISFEPKKTLVEFLDWSRVLECVEEAVQTFFETAGLVAKRDVLDDGGSVVGGGGFSEEIYDDLGVFDVGRNLRGRTAVRPRGSQSVIKASTSSGRKDDPLPRDRREKLQECELTEAEIELNISMDISSHLSSIIDNYKAQEFTSQPQVQQCPSRDPLLNDYYSNSSQGKVVDMLEDPLASAVDVRFRTPLPVQRSYEDLYMEPRHRISSVGSEISSFRHPLIRNAEENKAFTRLSDLNLGKLARTLKKFAPRSSQTEKPPMFQIQERTITYSHTTLTSLSHNRAPTNNKAQAPHFIFSPKLMPTQYQNTDIRIRKYSQQVRFPNEQQIESMLRQAKSQALPTESFNKSHVQGMPQYNQNETDLNHQSHLQKFHGGLVCSFSEVTEHEHVTALGPMRYHPRAVATVQKPVRNYLTHSDFLCTIAPAGPTRCVTCNLKPPDVIASREAVTQTDDYLLRGLQLIPRALPHRQLQRHRLYNPCNQNLETVQKVRIPEFVESAKNPLAYYNKMLSIERKYNCHNDAENMTDISQDVEMENGNFEPRAFRSSLSAPSSRAWTPKSMYVDYLPRSNQFNTSRRFDVTASHNSSPYFVRQESQKRRAEEICEVRETKRPCLTGPMTETDCSLSPLQNSPCFTRSHSELASSDANVTAMIETAMANLTSSDGYISNTPEENTQRMKTVQPSANDQLKETGSELVLNVAGELLTQVCESLSDFVPKETQHKTFVEMVNELAGESGVPDGKAPTGVVQEWVPRLDGQGRTFYLHLRSGMTSFDPPVAAVDQDTFSMTKRYGFLPKGLSPILQEPTTATTVQELTPGSRLELHKDVDEAGGAEQELATVKWGSEAPRCADMLRTLVDDAEKRMRFCEARVPNACIKNRSGVKVYDLISSYTFSKEIFKGIQVLRQVDNKFLVTLVCVDAAFGSHLLVIFDQHAVHERIRLEHLMADYLVEGSDNAFKSSDVDAPFSVVLTAQESRLVSGFRQDFERVGLRFELPSSASSMCVTGVPTCLRRRELREAPATRPATLAVGVESLVRELTTSLIRSRGVTTRVPASLQNIVNSEACRGAVKFGDPLSLQKCESLLSELSGCDLPFQCAHGRPSLVPIADMKQIYSHNRPVPSRPDYGKLKEYLQ